MSYDNLPSEYINNKLITVNLFSVGGPTYFKHEDRIETFAGEAALDQPAIEFDPTWGITGSEEGNGGRYRFGLFKSLQNKKF